MNSQDPNLAEVFDLSESEAKDVKNALAVAELWHTTPMRKYTTWVHTQEMMDFAITIDNKLSTALTVAWLHAAHIPHNINSVADRCPRLLAMSARALQHYMANNPTHTERVQVALRQALTNLHSRSNSTATFIAPSKHAVFSDTQILLNDIEMSFMSHSYRDVCRKLHSRAKEIGGRVDVLVREILNHAQMYPGVFRFEQAKILYGERATSNVELLRKDQPELF